MTLPVGNPWSWKANQSALLFCALTQQFSLLEQTEGTQSLITFALIGCEFQLLKSSCPEALGIWWLFVCVFV